MFAVLGLDLIGCVSNSRQEEGGDWSWMYDDELGIVGVGKTS